MRCYTVGLPVPSDIQLAPPQPRLGDILANAITHGIGAVLAIAGSLLGIIITFVAQAILKQTSPSLPVLLSLGWVVGSFGLAFVGAALGAVVPALRAASYDPVEALAYE